MPFSMSSRRSHPTMRQTLCRLLAKKISRWSLVRMLLAFAVWCIFCETLFRRQTPANDETFLQAVRRLASPNGDIVLAYVDSAYLDMAENFFKTSLKPHRIRNVLFVASDRRCCRKLRQRHGVACYVLCEDAQASEHTTYGESGFISKMNYRTDVILEAIEHGYTVLHTDTDMVYVKNPLKHINCSRGCDLAILMERGMTHNAGFVYVRPTERGISLYRQMRNLSIVEPTMDHQNQLNKVIIRMKKSRLFNYIRLPNSSFSSGIVYFEEGERMFANDNPSSDIVVIHNNWIVSKEAKIYRFKEHLMWLVDENGYYSKLSAKYLTYDNPLEFKDRTSTLAEERLALRNAFAIGQILRRVVILPSFHCGENERNNMHCALNSFYRIFDFDAAFGRRYREHMFLHNQMVPKAITRSLSDIFRIVSSASKKAIRRDPNKYRQKVQQLHAKSAAGPTSVEIKQWFGKSTEAVLRFDHLYGAFHAFASESEQAAFDNLIQRGFVDATYRQKP